MIFDPEKYVNLPSPDYYVIEAVCAAAGMRFDGIMPKISDAKAAALDAVGCARGDRLDEKRWQNDRLVDLLNCQN